MGMADDNNFENLVKGLRTPKSCPGSSLQVFVKPSCLPL